MKVILKENVEKLGEIGAILDVSEGFGRNYLIPKKLAIEANPKNIKQFEHEKRMIAARAAKAVKKWEDAASKLSSVSVAIEAQAGEEDKLFGSVTAADIADAVLKQGIEIDKRRIVLDEPIKRLGSYELPVKLYKNVAATIKLEVKRSES
ncbi:MAG: 50S ribosomal protein L9 [Nitrospirae bacterium]|nr:50S ribosomal protein L9 [Nitrospirota bacterium]